LYFSKINCLGEHTTKKKIILPGEYICGAEELMPGRGAYSQNDEVYSAVCGIEVSEGKDAQVKSKKHIKHLAPGDDVYAIVKSVMETKALLTIIPIESGKGERVLYSDFAAVKVQDISDHYVKSVKDEFRPGDILKAKVISTRAGVDVSTKLSPKYGVVKAFCSNCRSQLVLKSKRLMCTRCERTERRKLSEDYPSEGESNGNQDA